MLSRYKGAAVIDSYGARLGELKSLPGASIDTAVIRIGGWPDFMGLVDVGGLELRVELRSVVFGEPRTIGRTMVALVSPISIGPDSNGPYSKAQSRWRSERPTSLWLKRTDGVERSEANPGYRGGCVGRAHVRAALQSVGLQRTSRPEGVVGRGVDLPCLALMDLSRHRLRQVAGFDGATHLDPQFSPDGRSLHFVSSPNGCQQRRGGVRVDTFGYLVAQIDAVRPFDRPDNGWQFLFSVKPGF
jgi:hypothetical protein